MIFAHIDEDPDRRRKRGRKIDLIGGHLDHVGAACLQGAKREDRGADIAADLHVAAGGRKEMRDERGRRRLAVCPGDRDECGLLGVTVSLAAEKLDVADHFHIGVARKTNRPMRRWMGERYSWSEQK